MKIIHCPINGPRPLQEFYFGGQYRSEPETTEGETISDSRWADYVFNRNGAPGIQKEWWYHTPSGTWFIAERDIVSDTFIRTYLFEKGEGEKNV